MSGRRKLRKYVLGLGLVASVAVFVLVLTTSGFRPRDSSEYQETEVRIGEHNIQVRIPRTPEASALGLGRIPSLPNNEGMLWVYASPQKVQFWMKDMRFDLDFVWIRSGAVVGLTRGVQPPASVADPPRIVTPGQAVDAVLEINAGVADELGLEVGTPVTWTP